MLEDFTAATFEPLVGDNFRVSHGSELTLDLVDVRRFGAPKPGTARSTTGFSLLFVGPADVPLTQATYELSHPELGTFPLFLVPVGVDERGMQYEAVFTRLT